MKILFLEVDTPVKRDMLLGNKRSDLINFIVESTGCKIVPVQGEFDFVSMLVSAGIKKQYILDGIKFPWFSTRPKSYVSQATRWLANYRRHRKPRQERLDKSDVAVLAFTPDLWGKTFQHRLVRIQHDVNDLKGLTMTEALKTIALLSDAP